MTSDVHVRFSGVHKAFAGKSVLAGVDLDVRRGEVLSLLGASGSGKSVLLKLLIGLQEVDEGKIELDGADVTQMPEAQRLPLRQGVSMLFQSGALFDSLTVGENVAYPLGIAGRVNKAELRDRVRNRLELVGLPGTENLRTAELSGGMRKRVGLARAIVGEPKLILYDEPTTGLDPLNTRRIDELILSIRDRMHVTSLVVTHDLASAFLVSDRLAMLSEGRVIAALPPKEFARSRDIPVGEFLSAMPFSMEARP